MLFENLVPNAEPCSADQSCGTLLKPVNNNVVTFYPIHQSSSRPNNVEQR